MIYASYDDITPITDFHKSWPFLNPNGTPPVVELDGVIFPTLTHALNATKTPNVEERLDLISVHPFSVTSWGSIRPFSDSPHYKEWDDSIKDDTLILVAQRFGLVTLNNNKASVDNRLRYRDAFWLTLTRGRPIRYENLHCETYWGICYCSRHAAKNANDYAVGSNELGKAMMTVRSMLIRDIQVRDFLSGTCDWCYEKKNKTVTVATEYMVYFRSKKLTVRSYCPKHYKAEKHEARRWGDGEYFIYPITETPPEIAVTPIQSLIVPERRGWRAPRNYSNQLPLSNVSRPRSSSYSASNSCSTSRSCWSDTRESKDSFGVLIWHGDGSVTNRITSAV